MTFSLSAPEYLGTSWLINIFHREVTFNKHVHINVLSLDTGCSKL